MQPNLLFITTDQHRPDAVGWARRPEVETPHLNRLARSGCVFEDAVSICPVCHPARSALLTGLYAHQTGEIANQGDLDPRLETFPKALQRAGYRTECVGKGHWIHHTGQTPENWREVQARQREAWGWDFWWEASGKELVDHHHCDYSEVLREAGVLDAYLAEVKRLRHHGYKGDRPLDDRWIASGFSWDESLYCDVNVGRVASERLETLRAGGQPFCLWTSFLCPHPPYDPPARYLEAVPPDSGKDLLPADRHVSESERRAVGELRRRYHAMVRLVDDQVGLLLDTLERTGQSDNTLVVFSADHGEMMGDHGLFNKNSYYRSSVGIPMAMSGPGVRAGGRRSEPVELTDITATLLDAAGLDPAAVLSGGAIVPCRSLLGMAADPRTPPIREHAFAGNRRWQMVQTARWKYVHQIRDHQSSEHLLFDRERDPGEQQSLIGRSESAGILLEMQQRLLETLSRSPAPCGTWGRP